MLHSTLLHSLKPPLHPKKTVLGGQYVSHLSTFHPSFDHGKCVLLRGVGGKWLASTRQQLKWRWIFCKIKRWSVIAEISYVSSEQWSNRASVVNWGDYKTDVYKVFNTPIQGSHHWPKQYFMESDVRPIYKALQGSPVTKQYFLGNL